jgi:hypothetical protein
VERTAEEEKVIVGWPRPEYQNPAGVQAPAQIEIETEENTTTVAASTQRRPWSSTPPDNGLK